MAEVTYYFDVRLTLIAGWNDVSYLVDGILTNYAYTASDGAAERCSSNTCPGTDLGTITKVEIRTYGYGDGDDRLDLTPNIFGDMGDEHQLTMPSSPGWSAYADITNDSNMPSPWTWTNIHDLDVKVEFSKVGKANTMYCAKVEIRVTYTPPPPAYIPRHSGTVATLMI